MYTEFDTAYGLFEGMFAIVFILVIGSFVVMAVKGLSTWNKNNNSPRLTVSAVVVAKRSDVSYHHHANVNHTAHVASNTIYYVTFTWRAETGWSFRSAEANMECWWKGIRESSLFREQDIYLSKEKDSRKNNKK